MSSAVLSMPCSCNSIITRFGELNRETTITSPQPTVCQVSDYYSDIRQDASKAPRKNDISVLLLGMKYLQEIYIHTHIYIYISCTILCKASAKGGSGETMHQKQRPVTSRSPILSHTLQEKSGVSQVGLQCSSV